MTLVKAMVTVAGLTGLSRIAGFLRDILTAAILGAGPVADAFFVALKLPNFFRRVTAEGAFSVSFVPLYSRALESEGEGEADRFASNAFAMMIAGLGLFSVLAMAAMPFVIHVIAPGFAGDEVRFPLAVELSRVTFPYLLMMSLSALLGGVLNTHERFAPFAAAPIFFNLCLIAALLLNGFFETAGHALAYGVFAAGIVQFILLWLSTKRAGVKIRLVRPKFDAKTKKLLALMGPGVIGAGVMHINLFADLIIGSMLETGSISYLYYADRLNQLPLGTIGIAVGTALLPMLSKAMAADNKDEARNLFNRALEMCFLLGLPAAVGLFFTALPIIVTLFEHGSFTKHDSIMTVMVLTAYAVGLPAYVAVKVFSSAYWARQDTATPVKIAVAATLANIAGSLYLAFVLDMGVIGIAASTAAAGWIQIGLLAFFLRGREEVRFDWRLIRNVLKIVFACALMSGYLIVMKAQFFHVYFPENAAMAIQILALVALIGGAIVIYGLAVTLTGVIKVQDIKKILRRG
ncbi:MAG: murein biosynthesis integral membrane protein MurJ [Rhodospirillales bacterium]|nr:murein biosynthesis integral membrane protein MurJ [Rhodospirillales bacterium]